MDQEQLNAIKERVENATNGPWQVYEMEDGTHIGTAEHHPQLKSPMHVVTMSYWGEKPHSRVFIDQHNAEFIVNAIEDVPALVAEVERLSEELTQSNVERMKLVVDKDYEKSQKSEYIKTLHLVNEENKRLREALEKVMEVEAPIMEGWETSVYEIARKALGGKTHE